MAKKERNISERDQRRLARVVKANRKATSINKQLDTAVVRLMAFLHTTCMLLNQLWRKKWALPSIT